MSPMGFGGGGVWHNKVSGLVHVIWFWVNFQTSGIWIFLKKSYPLPLVKFFTDLVWPCQVRAHNSWPGITRPAANDFPDLWNFFPDHMAQAQVLDGTTSMRHTVYYNEAFLHHIRAASVEALLWSPSFMPLTLLFVIKKHIIKQNQHYLYVD